jgi:lipopolysaccharide/colanic/teichoic acid biosynthesis glycosyltransferase
LLLVALAVLALDGRPVFFRQERVGLGGRDFRIWKFRTMRHGEQDEDCPLITASGDPRVTRLGGWLRSLKLDEWPQLINVLAGQMSLIGPRPEVKRYVDPDSPVWQKVLSVRPGITDLATLAYVDEEQDLAGHADIDTRYRKHVLPAKLSLNLRYIECRSNLTDLQLIFLTLCHILHLRTPGKNWIGKILKGAAQAPAKNIG